MILARYAHGSDIYGPVLPACSAMAPHRGDVTTMRAADFVRLQAAKRVEKPRTHVASRSTAGTAPLPSVGHVGKGTVWTGLLP